MNDTTAPETTPVPVPEAAPVAADAPAKELGVGAVPVMPRRYDLVDAAYADLLPKAQAVLVKALDGQLNSEPHRELTVQVALALVCGRL